MWEAHRELFGRLCTYAATRGVALKEQLGHGQDGIVYSVSYSDNDCTALKVFKYREQYQQEAKVYLRLQEYDISVLGGFAVPRLIHLDPDLWIIEMSVVSPPFVVDFAAAYLDVRGPHTEESWEEWEAQKREEFEEHWP